MESIGVVILTKNNFDYIERCLNSFKEKNTYSNLKFYVGDTGSNSNQLNLLEKYLSTFPFNVELIKFKNYNFARNHNWIVNNRVKEEYFLCCNDDIELINDAVSIMWKETASNIGTIGCKLLYPDNTIQHGGHIHHIYNNSADVTHKHLRQKNKQLPTEYNVGNTFAFVLIKKSIYLDMGGLDTSYKKCFEDVDFCIKCTKHNLKHKFVGKAECYHYESVSRNKLTSSFDIEDCNKIRAALCDHYKIKYERNFK